MRWSVPVVLLAACGHVNFDGSGDGGGGGGGGDGGGVIDAAGDGVAAANDCRAGTYELCDGFEGDAFAAYWTVDANVTLDTIAHRGAHSAHFQLPALPANTTGETLITEAVTLPLGDQTFYVRMYMRLGSLPAGGNAMEIISAVQTSFAHEDALFLDAADLAVYSQWPDNSQHNLEQPATNAWLCVLFTVKRATTAIGEVTLGGDETATSLTNVQTDGNPPLVDLQFGPQLAGTNAPDAQPVLDMWIDDLIVDKNPLTCAE
ncbi:MAG TPA: hypothetical protein VMJ10_15920 [Kofleriaceae bacterium]|nr:hypothetical protein [Kofleriaceae bacterium]